MDKEALKKLCEDTLAAIEGHGRGEPIQKILNGSWHDLSDDKLQPSSTYHWYRPKPKKPRIAWVEIDDDGEAETVWLEHELYKPPGLTKFIEVIDE